MITYVQGSHKKYQQRLHEEKSEAELSKRKRIIDKNDGDAQKEKLKLNEERKRKIHQKEGEVKKLNNNFRLIWTMQHQCLMKQIQNLWMASRKKISTRFLLLRGY